MIKNIININGYWKIIVYYNVDYNLFQFIEDDLLDIDISDKMINRVYNIMSNYKAKAVTISNNEYYSSIVCFNKYKNKYDYINSIVHEPEHIKQAMLETYNVEDEGEPPAYTIGFIVMKMLMIK